MLLFAEGQSVGASTQPYASLGFINLGDPVISLKQEAPVFEGTQQKKQFDRSIGKQLSPHKSEFYQVFDYNKDGKEDIILVQSDHYFHLFENS